MNNNFYLFYVGAVKFQRRPDGTLGSIPVDVVVCHRIEAAADAVDQNAWVANGDYELVGVSEVHGTASTSGTLMLEKCTGTTAPGSGTDILTGTISLAGAANTVLSGTVTATRADRRFASGDRLALDFGGTVTSYANGIVTIYLKKIQGPNSSI